jgi:regulator of sigma E protease
VISSILVFVIVLSILVLVHEAGHFFAAKKAGVWVEEFGFGIPPRIWGKKVGETIYSINLLPFGGFVKLHGENTDEGVTDVKRAFLNKDKKTRAAIVTAGVIMNFILGIFAFGIVYTFSGIPKETNDVKILEVASSSPAQEAGLLSGDIVRKVDGQEITSTSQFVGEIDKYKGEKVTITVDRNIAGKSESKEVSLVPRANPPGEEGPIGVVISSVEIYFPPIWQRPFVGVYYGFKDALYWGKTLVLALGGIFTNLLKGHTPKDIAGPVGIFAITSEAAKVGLLAVINFVGVLSVNLAIINIIPFPALDGGRLAFIGIESLFGRRVMPKVESVIHTVGMVILLILLLAITASDVTRLIQNGGVSGFIDSFLR